MCDICALAIKNLVNCDVTNPQVREWRDENLKKLAVFKQGMSEQPR